MSHYHDSQDLGRLAQGQPLIEMQQDNLAFLLGQLERPVARVVTDIGLMEPDANGELILTALHPGRTADEAKINTGWDLKLAPTLKTTQHVTEKELQILREELDPKGIYLKGA